MNRSDLFCTRDYRPESDKNFIFATWLRGLYYGCDWYGHVPKDIFMAAYHHIIEALLAAPGVKVRIVCLKEDSDIILGFSVTGQKDTAIHWVFVKSHWRRIGIGKTLVPATVKATTHLTREGMAILRRHPEIVFNPFLGA